MDPGKVKQILLETEAAAQEILIAKEEITALDHRRQKTREAFRAIKSGERKSEHEKTWMSIGNVFVKIRKHKAVSLLERGLNSLYMNL